METTVLPQTSLSIKPACAAKLKPPEHLSGGFAKILHDQPFPDDDGKGKEIPKGQEEASSPSTDGELQLLLSTLLPAASRMGNDLFGKDADAVPGKGQDSMVKGTPVQVSAGPEGPESTLPTLPAQGLNMGKVSAAGPGESEDNGFKGGKGSDPGNLFAKEIFPTHGHSSRPLWEEAPEAYRKGAFSYLPSDSENFLSDSNPSIKGESTHFNMEIMMRGKEVIPDDPKASDLSNTGSQKNEETFGMFARQMDPALSPNPAKEIGSEKALSLGQNQKLEVYEQVGQKLIWSLNQHEERFRLTLDPPQLGSIYMEIQRDKEHIKASLWAENPNTKNILETNHLSIQKIIESGGFSLESFNVFVEQDLGSFQESRGRMMNPESLASIANAEIPLGPIQEASSLVLPFGGNSSPRQWVDLIV
jgi:hypothetical protein